MPSHYACAHTHMASHQDSEKPMQLPSRGRPILHTGPWSAVQSSACPRVSGDLLSNPPHRAEKLLGCQRNTSSPLLWHSFYTPRPSGQPSGSSTVHSPPTSVRLGSGDHTTPTPSRRHVITANFTQSGTNPRLRLISAPKPVV